MPVTEPVAANIETLKSDFVILQEIQQRNRPILYRLRRDCPHQHFCPFEAVGDSAGGTFAMSHRRNGLNLLSGLPTIPIDHMLELETGASLSLDRRPRFGSNHRGLIATFAMERF